MIESSGNGPGGLWASTFAFAGTAAIADGPLPIGDVIGLAAIAGVVLYEALNPNAKNLIPSKGIPWREPPSKPTPGGKNPPEWVKNTLITGFVLGILNSLGKINPELSPKNWDLGPASNDVRDFFNDMWNKTLQGINDVNNGLKNGWPGR